MDKCDGFGRIAVCGCMLDLNQRIESETSPLGGEVRSKEMIGLSCDPTVASRLLGEMSSRRLLSNRMVDVSGKLQL